MEYRQFGKTDLEVSAIGFGCWEIGGTYGRIDESQFGRAVQSAIDDGINCFDTAEAYGMGVSEQALARAGGGWSPPGCLRRHRFRGRIPRNSRSARHKPAAGPGVDREEPAKAADRSC